MYREGNVFKGNRRPVAEIRCKPVKEILEAKIKKGAKRRAGYPGKAI